MRVLEILVGCLFASRSSTLSLSKTSRKQSDHEARRELTVARAISSTNLPGTLKLLAPLMPDEEKKATLAVDIVIAVHNERPEALEATLSACLKQTYPISKIFVVDDGSLEPVSLPQSAQSLAQICLLRLPQNVGISAARNAAIVRSNASLLACINTEVLPDPEWLATCESYLSDHPLCRSLLHAPRSSKTKSYSYALAHAVSRNKVWRAIRPVPIRSRSRCFISEGSPRPC